MITTRQGAADACDQLSDTAAKLRELFNSIQPPRPDVEHFLKGVVVRTGLHLKDSALLLRTNHDQHLSSVFVLCRVVLDDVIRTCFVVTSDNQQEALDMLTAKAYEDYYKTWVESGRLNEALKFGDALTMEFAKQEREKFLKASENKTYVELKQDGSTGFKKAKRTPEIIKAMEAVDRVSQYTRAYVLFKHMSHYVHYSMLPYHFDRRPQSRELEIRFLDEILFLSYHLLRLIQETMLKWHSTFLWPTSQLDESFNRPKYLVR